MFEFSFEIFAYQLGIFLVFATCLTVIYKILLEPVLKERRERIEGDMKRAAQARAEADELKSKYEKRMADVGDEASAIIKRVNEEAARHREDLLKQARHQAEALMTKAEELITIEEGQARTELRGQIADMAVAVAGRVLEGTRTNERERELAEKFAAEVEKRNTLDRKVDS
jgi:F-type H+-transporting ATPase subunit b